MASNPVKRFLPTDQPTETNHLEHYKRTVEGLKTLSSVVGIEWPHEFRQSDTTNLLADQRMVGEAFPVPDAVNRVKLSVSTNDYSLEYWLQRESGTDWLAVTKLTPGQEVTVSGVGAQNWLRVVAIAKATQSVLKQYIVRLRQAA